MNVIERKYYTCEKCGRMSQNEEKIKECEASHLMVKEDGTIEAMYRKGATCPEILKIEMADGSFATYQFDRRKRRSDHHVRHRPRQAPCRPTPVQP